MAPRYFALPHADDISTLMLLISNSFLLFELWLLRMFGLSGWICQSYPLGTLLEVAHLFLELHQRCGEQGAPRQQNACLSGSQTENNLSICPCLDLCQQVTSSFSAIWSTVLKSKLDHGPPSFVPLFYLKHVAFFVQGPNWKRKGQLGSASSWVSIRRWSRPTTMALLEFLFFSTSCTSRRALQLQWVNPTLGTSQH